MKRLLSLLLALSMLFALAACGEVVVKAHEFRLVLGCAFSAAVVIPGAVFGKKLELHVQR